MLTAKELAELWEPLAARCPELRPEGLVCGIDQWTLDTVPGAWSCIAPHSAAALWRDKAWRWLLERERGATVDRAVLMTSRTGSKYHADHSGIPIWDRAKQDECCEHQSLDHALAAAVKAVLNAKELSPC